MDDEGATTASEPAFGLDELFFSTTDPGGRIVACNPVFTRISGYDFAELSGRAHNIVRHSDMPRVVFRILWDHLEAGEPVAAYVKNRTSDGRPYWVVATASPIDGGYLSVRCKPSGPHFAAVRDLYAELREAEARVEAADGRKAAIDASAELLDARLAALGFAGYGAFMRAFLPAELQSREQALEGSPYWERLWHEAPDRRGAAGRGDAALGVLDAFRGAYGRMRELFGRIEGYETLGATLAGRSRDLTGDTRLLSLNALLSANRLGASGAALSVVADLIGVEADRTGAVTEELNRSTDALGRLLADESFSVSVGRLQAEMAVFFALEALSTGTDATAEIRLLADALRRSAAAIAAVESELTGELAAVTSRLAVVGGLVRALEALQLNGTIEASRIDGAAGVRQLFTEMQTRLSVVREEIDGLASLAKASQRRRAEDDINATEEAIARIDDRLSALDVAA